VRQNKKMMINLSTNVKYTNFWAMFYIMIADIWRVVLKGENKDYIHASFANVRAINYYVVSSLHLVC